MSRRSVIAFLIGVALFPLGAQEPVFRIRVSMEGHGLEGASFSSNLEIGYVPCAAWVGGSGGWVGTPAEYLDKAGGLAAIRPGMSLPFYAHSHHGSASGSDGSTASVVTIGPGQARWIERTKNGDCTKETDLSMPANMHQSARFYRTANGARIADFDLGFVGAGCASYIGCIDPYGLEDGNAVVAFSQFEITNEELANWKHVKKNKKHTFTGEYGSVTVTADLTAEIEDPGEVDITVEGLDTWIPKGNFDDENQPGNTLEVTATVRGTGLEDQEADRKAELTFELIEVGEEPGICLNWPVKASAEKGDLRLRQEENRSMKSEVPDRKIRTQGLVKKASVVVSSFDFAAWGVLKVTAKDKDGKPLRVTYHGKNLSALTLPQDEDRNHIADAWQKAKGVMGYPAEWDEAEISGQDAKGDGLALFEKNRGLMVLSSGGRSHLQPEPREKVHFVIDPDGLVDLGRLQAATGLRTYKVLEAWTRDRKVDIHANYAHAGGKYASLIRRDTSVVNEALVKADPARNKTKEQVVDELRVQWGTSAGPVGLPWRPSNVEGLKVFPGRIHDKLCRIRNRMITELLDPERYAEDMAWWNGLHMGQEERAQTLKRLQGLTDAEIWELVKPIEIWLAIHELSHGVGVNGHLSGEIEDEDCANRVPNCPMQYLTWQEKRRYLLFGELGGSGALCRQAPHTCWKQVNPKN